MTETKRTAPTDHDVIQAYYALLADPFNPPTVRAVAEALDAAPSTIWAKMVRLEDAGMIPGRRKRSAP